MTWIIGMASALGYASAISDVQVSWPHAGKTHDCLQKVHPIRPYVAAGFSGSVKLGFQLLDDLQKSFPPLRPGLAYFPRWMATRWWRRARRIFNEASEHDRNLKSSIMLLGVRPFQNSGNTQIPIADLIVMRSLNDFAPEFMPTSYLESIGSGGTHVECRAMLKDFNDDRFRLVMFEAGRVGNAAHAVALTASAVRALSAIKGVSRCFQLTTVDRSGILTSGPIDWEHGHEVDVPLAQSWPEFERIADGLNLTAAEATAH